MHPGMMYWWKRARHGHGEDCSGEAAACGAAEHGRRHWHHHHHWEAHGDDGSAGLGVRRPLRFLAYKLELEQPQIDELAKILNSLKTERAQAEVDNHRTLAAFADSLSGDAFDAAKANEGADLRTASAERIKKAVQQALTELHALLKPEQRQRLAYMLRTGQLSI
jgi:hypothetical protein